MKSRLPELTRHRDHGPNIYFLLIHKRQDRNTYLASEISYRNITCSVSLKPARNFPKGRCGWWDKSITGMRPMRSDSNRHIRAVAGAGDAAHACDDSRPTSACRHRALRRSALLLAAMCFGTAANAAVGDQIIARDLIASKGWTAVVPMNLNGDRLTDLLSYNAKTGRAVYSVAADPPGTQVIVRDLIASKGWTAIVPVHLNGDVLTDMISYNAGTGRTVYSIGADPPGSQTIVRDVIGAKGWTSIVPLRLNGDTLTDLLWYNRNTGRAVYATGASQPGIQQIVRKVAAPKGWTSIIPMDLNGLDLTDLLWYNRASGRAVYSLGASPPGTQVVARDLIASKGWTSLVPMLMNGDDGFSDLLSYNAKTGRAVYSTGANPPGTQNIVRDLTASIGWTAVVPMRLNDDSLTDLLSYNAKSGWTVYSVAAP
ncbi:MAG: hypothetical protein AB7X49_24695 [Geminicoccaceae bacterium]